MAILGKYLSKVARRLRRIALVVLGAGLLFLGLDLAFPLPPEKPYSQLIRARDGSLLNAYLSPDQKWRMRTRVEEVPEELVRALVAKEDRWFYYHSGVNPFSILRAAGNNLVHGRRTSGASTITMQLARMMEPKERTWGNKLWESFRALQLEWHYSKAEILGLYLSYLPYGGNIEGVKAASLLYFDRPPERLSLAQSVLLTVVPNRPNSLRPDQHPERARAARDRWLKHFRETGTFSESQIHAALREVIPAHRQGIVPRAPQFCTMIRRRFPSTPLTTTLDPAAQAISERLLKNHVRRIAGTGVTNGAVLVVDNASGAVVSYCGSADFQDKAAGGEVNAVVAPRSPGSTLKPLVYAMAFDAGLITPRRRLLDVPQDFHGYAPVNYDLAYRGEVTAEDALRSSLNLPAVRLLQRVGLARVLDHLARGNMRNIIADRADLGLSLALGGCDASLEELVGLYRAFANGGRWRPLRFVLPPPADDLPEGDSLCSPEAAWLLADILSGVERPDLPNELLDRTDLPRIAWKTGTSFGRRDAWAIGFNPRFTIGVWMGNMDGTPAYRSSGARTAVPLLVDLFNSLDPTSETEWFPRPPGLREVKVCPHTGLRPGPHCTGQEHDWHLARAGALPVCPRMQEVLTDSAGTLRYCKACLPASGYRRQAYPVYPPELLLWYETENAIYRRRPPHNPACEGVFYTQGPQITSPAEADEYFLDEGQSLALQAQPEADATLHYWFANDQFLGVAEAGKRFFFSPPTGEVQIGCMDDKGRMEEITVQVARL
ncbi:MAG: penicillin-binding protein 1C [Bacteroidota bacterium]